MDRQSITVQIEGSDELIELFLTAEDIERAQRDATYLRELVDKTLENRTLDMLQNEENRMIEEPDDVTNDDENSGSVFIWTEKCVALLLTLYEEYEGQFAAGAKRHQKIWEEISAQMEKAGYSVKWSQCQSKLNSLKRRYKAILDHNNKSGNDRKTWIYFDKMEEIFGKTGWAKPIAVASEAGPLSPAESTICSTPKRPSIKRKLDTAAVIQSFKEEQAIMRAEKEKKREERVKEKDAKFEKLLQQKERQHREKMKMMKQLLELQRNFQQRK